MSLPVKFIIVDDDNTNNNICLILIKKALNNVLVDTFTDAQIALNHIKERYTNDDTENSILFLDINMPTMTGWDFLDQYNILDDKIKNRIRLYVVSSSLYSYDQEKAANNKNVRGYLVKPLSANVIRKIYNEAASGTALAQ